MHELALAQEVFHKITLAAQKRGLAKITFAKVKIGALRISHRQEFEELFYDLTRGTPLQGMQLAVEIVPLKTICAHCHTEFDPQELRLSCPHCHSSSIKMISGEELAIEEIK
jgi:hydrogenase nickel insertion protein HypA